MVSGPLVGLAALAWRTGAKTGAAMARTDAAAI
jgi:hypothetical protein